MKGLLSLVAVLAVANAGPLASTKLRVQNIPVDAMPATAHVLTVDAADTLRFSWARHHTERAVAQTHCRVVVSPSADLSSPVWDSGMVPHTSSMFRYAGPQLRGSTDYFWAVQWRDGLGTCLCLFCRV